MSAVATAYEELVRPDRIHGSLHFDPHVFAEELERIWYREWVYIGHESEVPEPGTYARKTLGRQPVILTRDTDGDVHVLYNRCAHLANLLCHERQGTASLLRCPFHGWTYRLDGSNAGVPYVRGYGPEFVREAHPLGRPARVDSHRGFVFASAAADGPGLIEFLGPAAGAIDQLCELSPDGEVELSAGWLSHRVEANWKLGYEGALDGYHPRFVHRSLISLTSGSNFAAATDSCPAAIRSLGNGHGDLDWAPYYQQLGQELAWAGSAREKLPGYVSALERRHGPERAHELLVQGPPHVMISPNLFIAELFILVLEPLGPRRHVQHETPILWKGAPALNARNLRQTGASIGPAGMVLADDVAMMERNQRGLEALEPEWLIRCRGLHRQELQDGGIRVGRLTDDAAILGFWENYLRLMSAP
jgi:phenylpropionate dioxygenase-like ring-hydroxylating dioxygenase large terminal subunit